MGFKIKNISSSYLEVKLSTKTITLKSGKISERLNDNEMSDEITSMVCQDKITTFKDNPIPKYDDGEKTIKKHKNKTRKKL